MTSPFRVIKSAGRFPGDEYRSTEVAKATGATLRQLQWWDERRVLKPRHDGHTRYYKAREVLLIALLVRLRKAGFCLQLARKALSDLSKMQPNPDQQILLFSVRGRKSQCWATSAPELGRLLPEVTKTHAIKLVAVNLSEVHEQLHKAGIYAA